MKSVLNENRGLSPIIFTIVASSAINGSINIGSQLNQYGEIKYPAELAINLGFGALEGYLGKYGGIGWNAGVGAGSNVATTLTVNWNYDYDQDHNGGILIPAITGAGFGATGKALEEGKLNFIFDSIKTRYFR